MGFQDVTFLPCRASFPTPFLENCGRDESLGSTTCLSTVVGGKQVHAPCMICFFQRSLFFCVS